MKHFLTNRKQRVVLNWQSSTWNNVMGRVLQGSILQPLLILIHVSDLFDGLLSNTLICIKISNRSRMEPWRTLSITLFHVEDCQFNTTLCFQNYLIIITKTTWFNKLPDIPFSCTLDIRPSSQNLSKSIEMLRKTSDL